MLRTVTAFIILCISPSIETPIIVLSPPITYVPSPSSSEKSGVTFRLIGIQKRPEAMFMFIVVVVKIPFSETAVSTNSGTFFVISIEI